jgi:hypothetical protein
MLPTLGLDLMIPLQMAHQPMDGLESHFILRTISDNTLDRNHAAVHLAKPDESTVLVTSLGRSVALVPFLRLVVLAPGRSDAGLNGLVRGDVAVERWALASLEAALAGFEE